MPPDSLQPFRPKTDDPAEYWQWLEYVLKYISPLVPWGDDPQEIFWNHPDDDYKNENEAAELERQNLYETDAALEFVLTKWEQPDVENAVGYYTQKRLEFAQRKVRFFSTRSSRLEKAVVGRAPGVPHNEVLLWLLCDLYKRENGFLK